MALLFLDGFDQYTTATDLGLKWSSQAGNGVSTSLGRFGGGAADQGINDQFNREFSGVATMICGGAFKMEGPVGGGAEWIQFMEAPSRTHVTIEWGIGGFVFARNGNSGAVIEQSTLPVLRQDKWHWIEVQVTISNTIGQVTVNVDGVNVINTDSLQDTQNAGTAICDRIEFRSARTNGLWDDCYIASTTGGQITGFIGDAQIDNLMPDGDGNYTEFGTTTGTPHSGEVDEIGPDGDTTKVTSTGANERDTFTMDDLVAITTQSIHGVQQTAFAQHDGGATNFRTKFRISASDYDGASQAGGAAYDYFVEVWEQDPDAGPGAWVESVINGLESGVESL